MDFTDFVIVGVLLIGIVPLLHFIYRYSRYSPWRLTSVGRTLMYQKFAMVSVLVLVLLGRILGDYPFREPITIIVFAVLVSFFWRTDIELIKVQKLAKMIQPYDSYEPKITRIKNFFIRIFTKRDENSDKIDIDTMKTRSENGT